MTDYLEMADGTLIDPKTGDEVIPHTDIEVPSALEAIEKITAVRRRIADLPETPKRMNVVGVVMMYKLFGLDDYDAAIATNLGVEQVTTIQDTDIYRELFDAIVESLRTETQQNVREVLENASLNAARNMAEHAGQKSPLGLAAARDVLDRAGHRPVDIVEHKVKHEGGLTIKYIEDETKNIPDVEVL